MEYTDFDFKIPREDSDYFENSKAITERMEAMLDYALANNRHRIVLNTNLRKGLPLENINKIAGPLIEAWAQEIFEDVLTEGENHYNLVNVEAQTRLGLADVILQFEKSDTDNRSITANVDVKATSADIKNSGKGPNITSFSRIRTAYVEDPNFYFIVLSIKHQVISKQNDETLLMDGIMEITDFNAYDFKFLGDNDLNYNPALGTGQFQIRDIHYVTQEFRTTWDFCQMLDRKYLASSRRDINQWYREAEQHKWIKGMKKSR
ncbi:restriction endonuclease [Enterococcus sp. AZ126]|uniref:restriction endonuclease n=1 Tax=Enterococcus sp. AZ126 TaxID=2774635 RepID=UPI003F2976BE